MSISDKKTVHVVVVVDGRPGHEKQSLGIVQALKNRISVTTTIIDVSKRGFFSQLQSYFQLLFVTKKISLAGVPAKVDLVIGTGTRTHTTVLLLKKYFHIPAATCMTPGVHLQDQFDICFVPEHDGVPLKHNFFSTSGAPNNNVNKGMHSAENGLILLGGIDEKSHVWDANTIVENISKIIAREQDINWVVSSSPRTPESTVKLVIERTEQFSNCTFCDYKNTPKGWIESQYDTCKTVWVTTDSISMVYEALSSGCLVNIFPMPWKKDASKFKKNEDLLIEKRLVTPFAVWEKGSSTPVEPSQLNEAQRCADYILQTCWPKN